MVAWTLCLNSFLQGEYKERNLLYGCLHMESNLLDDECSVIHSFPQRFTHVANYNYYLMFGSMKSIPNTWDEIND